MSRFLSENGQAVDADLLGSTGEFASVWQRLGRASEPMSADFAGRVSAAVRAELTRAELTRAELRSSAPMLAAAQPVRFRLRVMLVSMAAAAVAAFALGLSWYAATAPSGPSSLTPSSNLEPRLADTGTGMGPTRPSLRAPDAPEHDLTHVESLPSELLESVEGLADLRQQSEALEQEIARLADGPTVSFGATHTGHTTESLDAHFPFLDRTFEQTLEGL